MILHVSESVQFANKDFIKLICFLLNFTIVVMCVRGAA